MIKTAFFDTAASLLMGILSGMGIGGGGLLVIYLTLPGRVPQKDAQAVNLGFFIIAAISSLVFHLREHRVDVKKLLTLTFSGIAGSLMGTYFAKNADGELLTKLFGWMLLLSGTVTLFKCLRERKRAGKKRRKKGR